MKISISVSFVFLSIFAVLAAIMHEAVGVIGPVGIIRDERFQQSVAVDR